MISKLNRLHLHNPSLHGDPLEAWLLQQHVGFQSERPSSHNRDATLRRRNNLSDIKDLKASLQLDNICVHECTANKQKAPRNLKTTPSWPKSTSALHTGVSNLFDGLMGLRLNCYERTATGEHHPD